MKKMINQQPRSADADTKLAAPVWELAGVFGNVITQEQHDAFRKDGYPVIVNQFDGMQASDVINLYVYESADPNRTLKFPVKSHTLSEKNLGDDVQLKIHVDKPPLEINGDYYLAYEYLKGGVNSLGDSDATALTVALKTSSPYGYVSPDLDAPAVLPSSYNRADWDNNQTINFRVTFRDASKLKEGDSIQPSFHVEGVTSGNLNRVTDRDVTPYKITAADIAAGTAVFKFPDPTSTPPRQTWTHADLQLIEASEGGMYFKYHEVDKAVSVSSPATPFRIDTVNPYSNPPITGGGAAGGDRTKK